MPGDKDGKPKVHSIPGSSLANRGGTQCFTGAGWVTAPRHQCLLLISRNFKDLPVFSLCHLSREAGSPHPYPHLPSPYGSSDPGSSLARNLAISCFSSIKESLTRIRAEKRDGVREPRFLWPSLTAPSLEL